MSFNLVELCYNYFNSYLISLNEFCLNLKKSPISSINFNLKNIIYYKYHMLTPYIKYR